jgi:hypothetical protein
LILELTLDSTQQQIQQEVKIYQQTHLILKWVKLIYDINKNLVCIGKLSKPVALITGDTIMIELALDF